MTEYESTRPTTTEDEEEEEGEDINSIVANLSGLIHRALTFSEMDRAEREWARAAYGVDVDKEIQEAKKEVYKYLRKAK